MAGLVVWLWHCNSTAPVFARQRNARVSCSRGVRISNQLAADGSYAHWGLPAGSGNKRP